MMKFSGTILYAFFSTCKEKNADYDKIKKCYKIEKRLAFSFQMVYIVPADTLQGATQGNHN